MEEIYLKRNIIIIYISIIFILISQISFSQITATQMGMLDFQVCQSLSENEMNGAIDVTEKLQAAVDSARLANKTLFIPFGTYKVSNTIHCILEINNWWLKTPVCIVGSTINPPVIKLEDNLLVFNGAEPKAVFHYSVSDPDTYGTDGIMEGGLRSIDFDLGSGNTKSVAIYWGCAQHCFIEDIHINAGDGFAGLTSMGGANNLLSNVTVTGGQYGIYIPSYNEGQDWDMRGSPQNTINGCKFINQSNTALWLRGWGGITLVGIDIVKNDGIAIKMDCGTYAPLVEFPFSIVDSKIEFSVYDESNCAIENLLRGSVSARGLYIKNAKIICDNNDDEDIIPTGQENDWNAVYRYNYIDKNPRAIDGKLYEGKHFDAVEGTQYEKALIHMGVSDPPSDLITRHIWESTPSFEDDDAVLVTSASEIQSAINSNPKVCIAKGTYELTESIILKENTILMGCPGRGSCGTIFKYGWEPTSSSWLIETENIATAETYLMDITTIAGYANYEGSVHWQAGENSIIRDLWTDKDWIYEEHDYIRLYISGNGGGRIFNYQDDKGTVPNNPNHRKVKVSGTSQQLTFYGLNLERGGAEYEQSENPMIEIENSSNIRIFGAKTETSQPYATINNSENIFMTSIIDLSHFRDYGLHYIKILGNSDKIEISNCMFIDPESSEYKIVEDQWNSNEPDRTMHLGLYHRNWTDYYKVDSSEINDIEQSSIVKKWFVYPNPTTSDITIKLKSTIENSSHCYIYNSLGIKVKSFELPHSGSTNLDMLNFTSGIYFFQIQSIGENLECYKILKN